MRMFARRSEAPGPNAAGRDPNVVDASKPARARRGRERDARASGPRRAPRRRGRRRRKRRDDFFLRVRRRVARVVASPLSLEPSRRVMTAGDLGYAPRDVGAVADVAWTREGRRSPRRVGARRVRRVDPVGVSRDARRSRRPGAPVAARTPPRATAPRASALIRRSRIPASRGFCGSGDAAARRRSSPASARRRSRRRRQTSRAPGRRRRRSGGARVASAEGGGVRDARAGSRRARRRRPSRGDPADSARLRRLAARRSRSASARFEVDARARLLEVPGSRVGGGGGRGFRSPRVRRAERASAAQGPRPTPAGGACSSPARAGSARATRGPRAVRRSATERKRRVPSRRRRVAGSRAGPGPGPQGPSRRRSRRRRCELVAETFGTEEGSTLKVFFCARPAEENGGGGARRGRSSASEVGGSSTRGSGRTGRDGAAREGAPRRLWRRASDYDGPASRHTSSSRRFSLRVYPESHLAASSTLGSRRPSPAAPTAMSARRRRLARPRVPARRRFGSARATSSTRSAAASPELRQGGRGGARRTARCAAASRRRLGERERRRRGAKARRSSRAKRRRRRRRGRVREAIARGDRASSSGGSSQPGRVSTGQGPRDPRRASQADVRALSLADLGDDEEWEDGAAKGVRRDRRVPTRVALRSPSPSPTNSAGGARVEGFGRRRRGRRRSRSECAADVAWSLWTHGADGVHRGTSDPGGYGAARTMIPSRLPSNGAAAAADRPPAPRRCRILSRPYPRLTSRFSG